MFTRRRLLAAGLAVLAAGTTPAVPAKPRNGTMDIKRSGSRPSGKGPAEYFTGNVRVDPLTKAPDPARVAGASAPNVRRSKNTIPKALREERSSEAPWKNATSDINGPPTEVLPTSSERSTELR